MSFPFSFWKPAAGGGGVSYLLSEDFEGTGIPAGWTTIAGSPNYDYATSPAPLAGSQSLGIPSGASTEAAFTASGDLWVYCKFSVDVISGSPDLFVIKDASDANVCRVRIISTGVIRVYNGAAVQSDSSAGAYTAGDVRHVWVHYVKGTGATDGAATLYLSTGTAATRPDSPTAPPITTGTATTNADTWAVGGIASTVKVYDTLRISTSEIGSNPT